MRPLRIEETPHLNATVDSLAIHVFARRMHCSDIDYEYVLYIDEAGNDGLARIKPIDKNGASE